MPTFRTPRPAGGPVTRRPGEDGFSLIEMLLVLLIIAILLAVAIPTYISARNRAENRAAQEVLSHADTAAMTAFARSGSWLANGLIGPIFPDENSSAIGTISNAGQSTIGAFMSSGLPPGTSLDSVIAEDHGSEWVLLENASKNGWCFGELSVESASSAALTGSATDPNNDVTVNLGPVPGVGTWFAAERQQGGSCAVGGFSSGGQSTWGAATANA